MYAKCVTVILSQSNILDIMTRLQAGQSAIQILVGGKICLSSKCPDLVLGPASLLFSGFWGSYLGVKQPGPEVNHLPSRAEVKNEWSYDCVPHIYIYMPSCSGQGKLCIITVISVPIVSLQNLLPRPL